jgi:hypothetical protein
LLSSTFLGIETIKYNNNYYITANIYKMYAEILNPTGMTSSGMSIKVTHVASIMKQLRISLLLFAQEY